MDKALTLKQAAEILDCHIATVRREIERGHLNAFWIGRIIRIRQSDLEAYMKGETGQ